jgi:hypothetical protein
LGKRSWSHAPRWVVKVRLLIGIQSKAGANVSIHYKRHDLIGSLGRESCLLAIVARLIFDPALLLTSGQVLQRERRIICQLAYVSLILAMHFSPSTSASSVFWLVFPCPHDCSIHPTAEVNIGLEVLFARLTNLHLYFTFSKRCTSISTFELAKAEADLKYWRAARLNQTHGVDPSHSRHVEVCLPIRFSPRTPKFYSRIRDHEPVKAVLTFNR